MHSAEQLRVGWAELVERTGETPRIDITYAGECPKPYRIRLMTSELKVEMFVGDDVEISDCIDAWVGLCKS